MKAHKPDMLAAWAKENKVAGWEKMYQAYDPKEKEKLLEKWNHLKSIKWIIDIKLLKKLENFYKFFIFNFIKIKSVIYFVIFDIKNSYFSFE